MTVIMIKSGFFYETGPEMPLFLFLSPMKWLEGEGEGPNKT